MALRIGFILLLLFLVSCVSSPPNRQENLRTVAKGVSGLHVLETLGAPDSVTRVGNCGVWNYTIMAVPSRVLPYRGVVCKNVLTAWEPVGQDIPGQRWWNRLYPESQPLRSMFEPKNWPRGNKWFRGLAALAMAPLYLGAQALSAK